MEHNFRVFQLVLQPTRNIIRSIVQYHMNTFCLRMSICYLPKQTKRRFLVHRLRKICKHLHCVNVHRPIDIHSLTTTVRLQFLVLATTNPTISRNTILLRMASIGKIDRIVFALCFPQFPVLFQEGFLLFRIEFARHMLRLLVCKTKAM